MKHMTMVAVCFIGAFAWANEEPVGHQGEAAHAQPDAPSFVLEHVSDSEHVEFELPWGGEVRFDVARPFGFLLIDRVAGACDENVRHSLVDFPSLGRFIDGCYDLRPTKAVLMIWIAMALLLVVMVLSRRRDEHGVARGFFANSVEALYLYVRDEIARASMDKAAAEKYTPYLASLFFFVLFVNWLGLVPGMFTATGVLAVTAGLAIMTFVLTQVAAIRSAGIGGYLKHFTGGVSPALWIFMIPVEIIGLFTRPFALLIRLFANMLGGHMSLLFMLALIFMIHPSVAALSVPMAAALYLLEIFVGILQAYLFTLLSALFIGMGAYMGEHNDAVHEDAAH